jgi:hypothetical protein
MRLATNKGLVMIEESLVNGRKDVSPGTHRSFQQSTLAPSPIRKQAPLTKKTPFVLAIQTSLFGLGNIGRTTFEIATTKTPSNKTFKISRRHDLDSELMRSATNKGLVMIEESLVNGRKDVSPGTHRSFQQSTLAPSPIRKQAPLTKKTPFVLAIQTSLFGLGNIGRTTFEIATTKTPSNKTFKISRRHDLDSELMRSATNKGLVMIEESLVNGRKDVSPGIHRSFQQSTLAPSPIRKQAHSWTIGLSHSIALHVEEANFFGSLLIHPPHTLYLLLNVFIQGPSCPETTKQVNLVNKASLKRFAPLNPRPPLIFGTHKLAQAFQAKYLPESLLGFHQKQ